MLKLYYAPRTRSLRIAWLLEELGLPYDLERGEFSPPARAFFVQKTPLGKFPTLEDGELVMCESGAIMEYILERYGNGRLAPAIGSPKRGAFLQWLHFAEGTAFPPVGIVIWLTRYRDDGAHHAELLANARERAAAGFEFLQRELGTKAWILGDEFSAADIALGFTLGAAVMLGAIDITRFAPLDAYLARLQARPAYQRVAALD
ncbi:MAG: glutathione S-transferase family protein [Solirubrobacteraceae bacterium]